MKITGISLSMLWCASAFAQEPASEPASPPASAVVPAAVQPPPIEEPATPKSPWVSFGASLGGAAVGAGLVALSINSFVDVDVNEGRALGTLGLVLLSAGPSAGQFYSGNLKHALVFSGARLGMSGMVLLGTRIAVKGALDADSVKVATGNGLAIFGATALVSFVLYDIFDAPLSVKRSKDEVFSLRLSPTPIATAKAVVPGMSLSTKF